MRFDIVHTLEIPQGATELTTSQLEQISGGHGYKQDGCKYGKSGKYGKYGKKGGKYGKEYGYGSYGQYGGKFKHEYGYGDDCEY